MNLQLANYHCPYCHTTYERADLVEVCNNCKTPNHKTFLSKLLALIGLNLRCGGCGDVLDNATEYCLCGNKLPPQYLDSNTNIIAVVGMTNSGKSVYITVLIEELKRYSSRLGLTVEPMDEFTEKNHAERVSKLYGDKVVLDASHRIMGEPVKPLIFGLSFTENVAKPTYLVFYDVSGEDYKDQANWDAYLEFLHHSSGFIWLIDPPNIGNWVTGHGLNSSENTSPDALFQALNRFANNSSNGELYNKTPIAICLTKIDLFRHHPSVQFMDDLFNPDEYWDSDLPKVMASVKNHAKEMESLIDGIGGGHFLQIAKQSYQNNSFFGISSLGHDPKQTENGGVGKLESIDAIRVEHPLFWIMVKLNLIEGVSV